MKLKAGTFVGLYRSLGLHLLRVRELCRISQIKGGELKAGMRIWNVGRECRAGMLNSHHSLDIMYVEAEHAESSETSRARHEPTFE